MVLFICDIISAEANMEQLKNKTSIVDNDEMRTITFADDSCNTLLVNY